MAEIRVCLLGAGRWGQRYIDTICSLDGVVLAALSARNRESLARAPEGCQAFTDWREAIAAPDIDGVIIATPPALHAEMALGCLALGRPVLIEKPLTLSVDEADIVERQFREACVLAMVGNTHLFNPGFLALKGELSAVGEIEEIIGVAGNYGPFRRDVTPLWDWAPHDLAMCLDLLGRGPQRLDARSPGLQTIDGGWGAEYHLDLTFSGGVTARIHVGNILPEKRRRLTVKGSRGEIVLDDLAASLTLHRDGESKDIAFSSDRPLTRQILAFVDAIRSGASSHTSLALSRDVVGIIARCERLIGGED